MANKVPSSSQSAKGGSSKGGSKKKGAVLVKDKKPVQKGGDLLEGTQGSLRTSSVKKAATYPIPGTSSSSSVSVENSKESSTGVTTTSNQIVICKQTGCHDIMTTLGFCRFHYLASWRKSKTKEAKKKGQELEVYLKDLARKFPEEFIEKLKTEVDELIEKEAQSTEAEETTEKPGGLFDSIEGDDDLDTIISGLKVEDF